LNDCYSSLSRECDRLANDDLTNVINLAEDFGFSRLKPIVGTTFGALQIELSRSERVLLDTATRARRASPVVARYSKVVMGRETSCNQQPGTSKGAASVSSEHLGEPPPAAEITRLPRLGAGQARPPGRSAGRPGPRL